MPRKKSEFKTLTVKKILKITPDRKKLSGTKSLTITNSHSLLLRADFAIVLYMNFRFIIATNSSVLPLIGGECDMPNTPNLKEAFLCN